MLGSSQLARVQLARSGGVTFDTTGPNCLGAESIVISPTWQCTHWSVPVIVASEDVPTVSLRFIAPDVHLYVSALSERVWSRIGKVSTENRVSVVCPFAPHAWTFAIAARAGPCSDASFFWGETRHVGREVIGTLSDTIRWANFFTGEGISNTLVYKVSPSIVRTFISTDAIDIYNFGGATLHLVDTGNIRTILICILP